MIRLTLPRFVVLTTAAILMTAVPLLTPAVPVSAAGSIQLSRNAAPPGDSVTVSGQGFAAGDTVNVWAYLRVSGTPRTVPTAAQVGNDGSFKASFTIPGGTDEATYAIVAKDQHGNTDTRYLSVLPLITVRVGGPVPTVTVLADHGYFVSGSGFGNNETVKLSAAFPLYSGNTLTVNASAQTNGAGRFYEAPMRVPRDAKAGTVTLTASGQKSGHQAKGNLAVTYRPYIYLSDRNVAPGDTITVNGGNFVPNSQVRVSVSFPRTDASTLTVSRVTTADGYGSFHAMLQLPKDTAAGTYSVTAVDFVGGFRAATSVVVSSAPVNATPIPAPSGPPPRKNGFGFQYVSLWYHVVRMGTWDVIVVQGVPHSTLGIWVHVIFPNGRHYDYYKNTNGGGKWSTRFTIPYRATTRHSNQALITLQLWKGNRTLKWFLPFTLV